MSASSVTPPQAPHGFLAQVPNLFTLLNLMFGCMAIVYLLQNGIEVVDVPPTPDNPLGQELTLSQAAVYAAPLCIGLAAIVDFFDGFLARLLGASSAMGKQLDSLADVVSFGVAPSIILYQLLRLSVAKGTSGLEASTLWLLPAFVLAGAAAYRLARFNLDSTTPATYFRGTPVPAVGLAIASFPLIYFSTTHYLVAEMLTNTWFLYGVVAVASWLMVSNLVIMSNKPKALSVWGLLPQLTVGIVALVSAFLLGWLGVPVTFVAFVLVSIILKKHIV
ncbi:MAG: CDP-alcohol phosphatidyltransferase [Bacteroidetes bacterium]|nr:MAG: CDP-alcohol phosphatidyltransferase [Bacteroidota bacterium]